MQNKYFDELGKRGFETGFRTGYKNEPWSKAMTVVAELEESRRGLRLYVLEGWKKYSRICIYFTRFVYLSGVDRGEYWAIRCPSTVRTIDEALAYTTPAEAHKAKKSGKKVLRQGDIFIIEKTRDCKITLPHSHRWDVETRVLTHDTHHAIYVPFPCKFVMGKSLRSDAD